jgi:hypothetical protein
MADIPKLDNATFVSPDAARVQDGWGGIQPMMAL